MQRKNGRWVKTRTLASLITILNAYYLLMILYSFGRTNIVEAHVQVQSLLKSEYSPEEMESIGMIPIPDLQAQLDSLL